MKTVFGLMPLFLLLSCGPFPEESPLMPSDITPPCFLGAAPLDSGRFVLRFDEPCRLTGSNHWFGGLPGVQPQDGGKNLIVSHEGSQEPGRLYRLETAVEDSRGNSTALITAFYGYNPEPPVVLINEVRIRGSSNHPDMVELVVLKGGNPAGLVVMEGVSSEHDEKKIFPSTAWEAGDYVLVHFKPQGLTGECDEIEAKDESAGLDSHPEAWDFWIEGGAGITGNNGSVALYAYPQGPLLDGLIFTNRTSASDEKYRGFGSSRALLQARELHEAGGWSISAEEIRPEDAVWADDSTATRTLCRSSESADTDSRGDWHTVPTSGNTFGRANSDEVYQP